MGVADPGLVAEAAGIVGWARPTTMGHCTRSIDSRCPMVLVGNALRMICTLIA
jgi:hypothetical protein